ncbi:MAG: fluoride efflux transporter CrcB [Burkholderiales bacterium]|nr:fluoride efflux transporter CrcB [Burkholderiales bacterium]
MSALGLAAVAIGAVLGAWLRWGLGILLNPVLPDLPLGTLTANLAGGLAIGAAIEIFAGYPGIAPEWRLAIITGFLGALTTYSTFSAEAVTLIGRGQYAWASLHVLAHLAGSLAMTAAGIAAVRILTR